MHAEQLRTFSVFDKLSNCCSVVEKLCTPTIFSQGSARLPTHPTLSLEEPQPFQKANPKLRRALQA